MATGAAIQFSYSKQPRRGLTIHLVALATADDDCN